MPNATCQGRALGTPAAKQTKNGFSLLQIDNETGFYTLNTKENHRFIDSF